MSSVFRRMRKRVEKNQLMKLRALKRKKKVAEEPKEPKVRKTPLEVANFLHLRRPESVHRLRALVCLENGVKNTGRQWKRLRRRLSREDRAQRAVPPAVSIVPPVYDITPESITK